jgi:hypothetical protein
VSAGSRQLQAGPLAGDPNAQGEPLRSCDQQLRAICAGTASLHERRTLAERVIARFSTHPIPHVARLGRMLRAWRSQALAYFDADGLSSGSTEAIKVLNEKAADSPTTTTTSTTTGSASPLLPAAPAPAATRQEVVTMLRSEEPDRGRAASSTSQRNLR